MTITYSFKITSINSLILYVDEENNEYNYLITKINYYYEGIDDDNIMAIYNSCISLPKPKTSDYKNYNDLTENDIILWLESLIPESELTLMKTAIKNNINDIKTRGVLPWSV